MNATSRRALIAGFAVMLLVSCGGAKGALVDGTRYPGLDQRAASDAYDSAYDTCYGPTSVGETGVADAVSQWGDAYLPVGQAACKNARLDIAACVAPDRYNNGGAYYCDNGSGRHLINPDGSQAYGANCYWRDEGTFTDWWCDGT